MRRLIEPSHLDLWYLQKSIIIACGSERVKDWISCGKRAISVPVIEVLLLLCMASANLLTVGIAEKFVWKIFNMTTHQLFYPQSISSYSDFIC